MRTVKASCFLACVLLLSWLASAVSEQGADTGLQLVPSYPTGAAADVLLVTLIDGSVVALDHATGRILWTYDTGAPLVSARQTTAPSQGMNLVPGAFGELYAYQGLQQPTNPGLQRLPISLPELVEAAPSLTADGSIILGKRESKVFLLDKRSGRGITTLGNAVDALEDHSGALGFGQSRDDVLVLGRQDYVVRSVRVDSKTETWNATFSRLYMMTRDANSIKDFFQNGAAPKLGSTPRARADLPRLVVGSDNSLQAFDSNSMMRKWYIAFNAMPISAHRQDGAGGNFLDPSNSAARVGSGSSSTGLAPHAQLNPLQSSSHNKLKGQLPGGTTVLVGALKGSLYALPADHLMLADGEGGLPGSTGTVVWPSRVGSLPMDITPADAVDFCDATAVEAAASAAGQQGRALPGRGPSPALAGPDSIAPPAKSSSSSRGSNAGSVACDSPNGSCDGGVLALVDEPRSAESTSLVALEPSDNGLLEELGSLTCPQPPLGIHSISVQQVQALTWLPDTPKMAEEQPAVSMSWSRLKVVLSSILGLLLLPLVFGWRAYTHGSSKATAMEAASMANGAAPAKAAKKHKSKKSKKNATGADAASTTGDGQGQVVTSSDSSSHDGVRYYGNDVVQMQQQLQLQQVLPAGLQHGPQLGSVSRAASAAGSIVGSPTPVSPSTSHVPSDPGAISPVPVSPVPPEGSSGGAPGMLTSRSYVDEDGAVVIGKLRVGPGILGYGSAGTIVYEGVLDSRPVAVKRLLRQFYNLARKEIQVLVVSDEHPNVVRCFAMEEDREFVYLALEKCRHSLSDTLGSKEGQEAVQDPATGAPTPWCMAILADIAAGLAALHARQIVHRDLKPHNVLLTEGGRAKLSDMGLSKQLLSEQSSFESHGSGGSSGWQAPEQLIAKDGGAVRQSRAVDVFSLGCIVFYCLTGGRHPFGEHYERDTNILRGLCNLSALQKSPEASNLIHAMLSKSPGQRPSMTAVLGHPFWWSEEQRLQFLVDVSDRVENEDREPDPSLLNALESYTAAAVGANWGASLDPELIGNLGKYRRYDYTCLRDLLRVVRNKRNHFREMPDSLQQLLGPVPDGYYRYFASRFPTLLLGVFFFALKHLDNDPNLAKYWPGGQHQFAAFNKPWEALAAAAAARLTRAPKGPSARRNSGGGLNSSRLAPSPLGAVATPPRPPSAAGSSSPASAAVAAAAVADASKPGVISFKAVAAGAVATMNGVAAAAAGSSSGSGSGSGGSTGGAAAANGAPPLVGYALAEEEEVLQVPTFPVRPGKQHCEFYLKTGHCKYGSECVFDHPPEYAVPLTEQGLPFRPDQPVCTFYQKTQQCKYGPSCKFHHPKLVPIYAGSAITPR